MGKFWDGIQFAGIGESFSFSLISVMTNAKMTTSFLKISQDFDLKVLKLRPRICYRRKNKIFFVSKSCCQCVKKQSKIEEEKKYLKKITRKNEEKNGKNKFYESFQVN